LSHPNITNIYELLHDERCFFIAAEFIRGGELFDLILKEGALNEEHVKHLVLQIFSALNYMHKI
jgi:serine/threonine protein kinase